MKYIKEYKIFESSADDFGQEVKECFLPVIDIITEDKLKIYAISENRTNLVAYINNDKNLLNEITDSIYQLNTFDINVIYTRIYYIKRFVQGNTIFYDVEKLEYFFKNLPDNIVMWKIDIGLKK
jgi:hypothetical protein